MKRILRGIGNRFGFAWWAKIETIEPEVTYWFGPFLRRSSLEYDLTSFLHDLSYENPKVVGHSFIRGHRDEPLTF